MQTFAFVIERLQKDPSNIVTQFQTPFPEKGEGMSDQEFYEGFQKALIGLDSFRAGLKEANWRDHPAICGKKAQIFVQKHINYADQQYHVHSYYEVTYIMKGSCTMTFDKKTLELRTGDLCMIVPSARHGIHIADDETFAVNLLISPYSFQTIMVQIMQNEDLISDYIREILYHEEVPNFLFLHSSDTEQLKALIKEITCCAHHPEQEYSYGMTYSWTSLFLCTVFREFRSSIYLYRNHNPAIQDNHLELLEYLYKEYKTVTLDRLAEQFGYNKSYASRLIRQISGKSFTEIILERKLSDACEYLERTDLPIQKIAQLCGFDDSNYFSKVFRKQYQMSPLQYRNAT